MASHTVFILNVFLVASVLMSIAAAQVCPDPVLPATCDYTKYDPTDPTAILPVVLDLTPALVGTGVANDMVGIPADDATSTGLIDPFMYGVSLPDGRVADVEVHGFGECKDVFSIRKNDNIGVCTSPGDCFEIGNTDAHTSLSMDYGRCLAERDPPSSASEYLLYDYGIVTVKLSVPTSTSFTVKLQDIDGHPLEAREMASVFGLGRTGQIIHPTSITQGTGQSLKFADIMIPEGNAIGMDVSSGPVTITTSEWVGTTPDGTMAGAQPGNSPTGPFGPYTDRDHNMRPETQTEFSFSGEEVYTIAIMFTYAESTNNSPSAPRTLDIKGGIVVSMDAEIGCAVPCKSTYNPASTIMKVVGDGSSGKCVPEVRATLGFVYDRGADRYCAEKYNCNWRATGPVDPADGLAPCTWTVQTRIQSTT